MDEKFGRRSFLGGAAGALAAMVAGAAVEKPEVPEVEREPSEDSEAGTEPPETREDLLSEVPPMAMSCVYSTGQ